MICALLEYKSIMIPYLIRITVVLLLRKADVFYMLLTIE